MKMLKQQYTICTHIFAKLLNITTCWLLLEHKKLQEVCIKSSPVSKVFTWMLILYLKTPSLKFNYSALLYTSNEQQNAPNNYFHSSINIITLFLRTYITTHMEQHKTFTRDQRSSGHIHRISHIQDATGQHISHHNQTKTTDGLHRTSQQDSTFPRMVDFSQLFHLSPPTTTHRPGSKREKHLSRWVLD